AEQQSRTQAWLQLQLPDCSLAAPSELSILSPPSLPLSLSLSLCLLPLSLSLSPSLIFSLPALPPSVILSPPPSLSFSLSIPPLPLSSLPVSQSRRSVVCAWGRVC